MEVCSHYFFHFQVFVESSSWSLVLVMFSLFCPLPSLRGVLELAPIVSNDLIIFYEDMEVDKIIRTLLTLGTNSSTPRRHGSGQNNETISNTSGKLEHSTSLFFLHFHIFVKCSSLSLVLVMFSLFCPLPCLRGVFELAPSVSNVLIILSTSMSSRSAPLGANPSTPLRHGSGQNNEKITNTRGQLEHSTKTWKWRK
jgi:hypothetical protein